MRLYKIVNKKRAVWGVDLRLKGKGRRYIVGGKEQALKELARLIEGEKEAEPSPRKHDAAIEVFAQRYFKYCSSVNAPMTVHQDMTRFKFAQRFFVEEGIYNLREITSSALQQLQAAYLENHKRRSWNNLLNLLKGITNRAVEWGILDKSPFGKYRALKVDKTYNFYSLEEIDKILDTATEPMATVIGVLANTGIRVGELFNLRWRDTDLAAGRIVIRPHAGFTTKSRKTRSIPISPGLHDCLIKLQRGKADDYICRPYKDIQTYRKNFKKILKRLELKGTIHDLRHTFASHLVMENVSIPIIKELLGHSDISTTMIYAHLLPETHKAAIDKLPFGRKKAEEIK